MSEFLQLEELNMITRDAKELILASHESAPTTITYNVPVNPRKDPVYGTWDADSWTPTTLSPLPRSIQRIIKPQEQDILKFAVIAAGDAIFYFDVRLDLSFMDYGSTEIKFGSSPLIWLPVLPTTSKQFWQYVAVNIGGNQIFQPIPCTIKK